jgi:Alginate export
VATPIRRAERRLSCALLLTFAGVSQGAEPPQFATHRYDDDWSAYCERVGQPVLDRMKCLPLPSEIVGHLSVGGEWRERLEAVDSPDFGIGTSSDEYVLHRLLLHADLKFGYAVRVFAQLGYHDESDRDGGPAPTDRDAADLQQGFVDASLPLGDGRATLRAGRQEFTLGSSRLVAVRESPNVRRSFDGVRVTWQDGAAHADAFYLRPVAIERGAFDDEPDRDELLWGAQLAGESRLLRGGRFEAYYLGYHRNDATFAIGTADERRYSLGLRLSGRRQAVDWNLELVGQVGDFGGDDIRAWTVASDTGYTFADVRFRPRLGLKADIASGDGDPQDGGLDTFNALYPNPTYFSEASLITPANFVDLQPSLTLTFHPGASLLIGWNVLWKQRAADAFYTTPPPLTPLSGSAGGSTEIGQQVRLEPRWAITPRVELRAAYVHFDAGAAVRQAGGRDVDFGMLSAAFRF